MQSKNDSTHTEAAAQRAQEPKVVTLSSNEAKDLVISVGNTTTTIASNNTTDKQLFEALCYEPFDRYVLEKGSHDGIRDEVFDAFYNLMQCIVNEVNNINEQDL